MEKLNAGDRRFREPESPGAFYSVEKGGLYRGEGHRKPCYKICP